MPPVQAAHAGPGALGVLQDELVRHHCGSTGRGSLQDLVDKVGEDNIMFETDFPHPTSLWPDPLEHVRGAMATLRPESRRKILAENGQKLYRLG